LNVVESLLNFAEGRLNVAEGLLNVAEGLLNVAEGLLNVAEVLLNVAEVLLNVAEGPLNVAESRLNVAESRPVDWESRFGYNSPALLFLGPKLKKVRKTMKNTGLDKLSDRDLIAELRLYTTNITGNEATYGLVSGSITGLNGQIDTFEATVDALDSARMAASAARGDRTAKRNLVIDTAKGQFKEARLNVANDSGLLEAINLDAYDTIGSPTAPAASAPFALIDFGILRHTINFRDSDTPDKRGKPDGMLGAEIWSKIGGTAPVSDADYSMVALDTSSPHIIDYAIEDAGKQVWYRLRWVTKTGEKGPWGETAEATINK
jgi:hypothetical protein